MIELKPEETFAYANKNKGAAIIGLAIVFALYPKFSGDTKPFAIYVLGVSLAFAIFVVNYLLGKAKGQ